MYPFIFYTSFGVKMAAATRGPVVFIRPEYKDDIGLREHEMTHVKQWFASLGLHSFLYLFCAKYKLWAEVQAYKVQLKYSPGREALFAGFIANRYGLDISQEEALRLLYE